ncbi:arginase family protein [Thalassotalea sp. M1531]|uniref:Arginase family protein n=1 Tax=Thalassotalea algicola TaxID=2716224 RepID=A0A7Y0Q8R3_9GAMM|nr:arginase family protein [Thalassotalea algicola]NMP33501.1 arginase family protein [Thalassotalea algicola]
MTGFNQVFLDKITQCLCPPGNGVFTVNTAKERKEQLHKALYGFTTDIDDLWQRALTNYNGEDKAVLLGVASDCGGGILRGANWGPLFLRSTLLEQHNELKYFDMGDIRVIPHLLHDKYLNDATISNCRKALYGNEQSDLPISPLSITEDVLHDFYAQNTDKGIFAIGGDHSVSYPLTKAYLQAKKAQGKRCAIIHFDAHTDLLIERLGIDLCFGSWCTHILDDLHAPHHLIQVGIRSSGKPKSHWENTFGVKQHWANEVRELGIDRVINNIKAQLANENIDELYVSFDIDALDAEFASATGTPEDDGLTPEEAMKILTSLSKLYPITGGDMMEIAPFTDSSGKGAVSAEKTLKVGAEISAFLIEQINQM